MKISLLTKNIKAGRLYSVAKKVHNYYQVMFWNMTGCPKNKPAPHLVKQILIKRVQNETGIRTFIETGTYMGEMVASVHGLFSKIYTIEIDKNLYTNAKNRFSNNKSVKVLLGDSGKILPKILKKLDGDLILWFDAHYSGGITGKSDKHTPIEEELEAIFTYEKRKKRKCYILIDDARCFVGKDNYPTLGKIKKLATKHNKVFKVDKDVIRLTPRK